MNAPVLPRGPRSSRPEDAVARRGHAWLDRMLDEALELDWSEQDEGPDERGPQLVLPVAA